MILGMLDPNIFCVNCVPAGERPPGRRWYRCLGHDTEPIAPEDDVRRRLRGKQPRRPRGGALGQLPDLDIVQYEAHGVIRVTHVTPRRKLYVPDAHDFSSLRDIFSGARDTFFEYVPVPDDPSVPVGRRGAKALSPPRDGQTGEDGRGWGGEAPPPK